MAGAALWRCRCRSRGRRSILCIWVCVCVAGIAFGSCLEGQDVVARAAGGVRNRGRRSTLVMPLRNRGRRSTLAMPLPKSWQAQHSVHLGVCLCGRGRIRQLSRGTGCCRARGGGCAKSWQAQHFGDAVAMSWQAQHLGERIMEPGDCRMLTLIPTRNWKECEAVQSTLSALVGTIVPGQLRKVDTVFLVSGLQIMGLSSVKSETDEWILSSCSTCKRAFPCQARRNVNQDVLINVIQHEKLNLSSFCAGTSRCC